MGTPSNDISKLIFKRTALKESGNVSIDTSALEVLMAMDGKKNLGAVAQSTGLDMATLRTVVSSLAKQKLIELSNNGDKMLGPDFQKILETQLAMALGPIAAVLVEEALADLNLNPGEIPLSRAAELIEILAIDIHREEKKSVFIQNMINIIKQNRP